MYKKQLAIFSLLIIFVIGIPLTIFIFSKQQEIRSRAEKSTMLYLSPNSSDSDPLQTQIGDIVPLDVMINPGTNLVSHVKLEILYDPTKFEIAKAAPFQANMTAFSKVVEGPTFTPGKMTVTLSSGTDLSKVIRKTTRVGTLKLKALDSTIVNESTTSVTYGTNTQASTIDANASDSKNVLSNTQPAIILIGFPPLPTCIPRPPCLDKVPKCLIPESIVAWCPVSTPTPTPIPLPTIAKCPNSSTDSMIIIDKSGSMNDRTGNSPATKIKSAKEAAKKFVDIISADTRNKTGLVSFSTTANLNSPLTSNYSSVKNLINSLSASGNTCHECAINKVKQEFSAHGRTNIKKIAILLTDGKANWIEGDRKKVNQSIAEQKAIDAVKNAYSSHRIVFYTIGLGREVNTNFLKQIADATGGKYYSSPTSDDLQRIYQEITQTISKGSISGFVFNDANNNKIYDQNESKLSGWTINLLAAGSTAPQSFISDGNGAYNIGDLCDGTNTVKEVLKTGWIATTPVNPNEYTVNIINGNAVTDKNFGNMIVPTATPTLPPHPSPTLTPAPQPPSPTSIGTTLLLNVLLDGIGSRGDNSNPDGSLSNKNPINPTRNIKIGIFNTLNQLTAETTGIINYSSVSGSFTGRVPLASEISSGKYTVKISTDNHLVRLVPGIQSITVGEENQLPTAIFVAGDIVSDNQLDIRDYNTLIDCYSDLAPATACNEQKKAASDLNEDSQVNQFDYNLFLRELATQPGE